jgi:hypothetical protein
MRELWRRPAASPPSDRCSHCHQSRVHPGGKTQCPLLPLSAANARLALADLDDGTALAVAEHVAATLARTPGASHDTVVAAAQAACA